MGLVVRSEVQRRIERSMRISTGFYEALEKKVAQLLEEAEKRAKGNRRRTLMASDV